MLRPIAAVIHKSALALVASNLIVGCGANVRVASDDGQDEEVYSATQALSTPAMSGIVGNVSSTPVNSAPSLEQKFLPGIGYMNGLTCDTWPRDVGFDGSTGANAVSDVLARYTIPKSVTVLRDLNTRLANLGISGATVVGSNHELTVVSAKQSSTGSDVLVALDTDAGQGYMLDSEWLCTEAELHASPLNCAEQEVKDKSGNPYMVLGRTAARAVSNLMPGYESNEIYKTDTQTVVLAAPSIHFNGGSSNAVVSDSNLIVIGQRVYGGSAVYSPGEDLSQRAATVSLSTMPNVQLYNRRPTTSEWKVLIKQPRVPSLLAVIADEMGGFSEIIAHAPAQVELIKVSNQFAETRWSPTSRMLYVRPEEYITFAPVSDDASYFLTADERQDGSGYKGDHKDVMSLAVSVPLEQRGPGSGGATFVVSARSNVTANLDADAGRALTVAHADGDVASLFLGIVEPWIGKWYVWYLGVYSPAPTAPSIFQMVHPSSTSIAMFDGPTWRLHPETVQATILDSLRGKGSQVGLFPFLEATPTLEATGLSALPPTVRVDDNGGTAVRQAAMGAQLFSGGAFADTLYARSEVESLQTGVISSSWADTARLVSDYNLGGTRITAFDLYGDMGLDPTRRDHALNMADAHTLDLNVNIHSNVLGLPYGTRVGDFYSVRTTSDAGPTSFYEAQSRWSQLASLVQTFNDAGDQTNKILSQAERTATLKLIGSLSTALQQGLSDESNAALTIAEAAQQNQQVQQKSFSDMQTAFQTAVSLDQDAQKQAGAVWGCDPSTQDATTCVQAAENKLLNLQNACQVKDMTVFTIGLKIMDMYPPIAAADAALKTATGKDFAGGMEYLLDLTSKPDGATRGPDIGNLSQLAAIAMNTANADQFASTSQTLSKNLADLLTKYDLTCAKGGAAQKDMDAFKQQVLTFNNTNQNFVNQVHLIRATMDGALGHIAYLSTEGNAYNQLADKNTQNINTLQSDTNVLTKQLQSFSSKNYHAILAKQQAFLQNACHYATHAARTASADLFTISQALQTATGRTQTEPTIVVPASPAYYFANGAKPNDKLASDARLGFATSLWDQGAFTSRFTPAGTGQTMDSLTLEAARFSQLISNEVCDASKKPATRYLVRKVLTGQAFRTLVSTGKIDFAVTLDDLVAGGNASIDVKTAMARTPATGKFDLQLGAPFVIDANYSLCRGGAGKECSARVLIGNLGTVASGKLANLMLANRGAGQVPIAAGASCDTATSAAAPLVLDKQSYTVSTCLASVVTPQEIESLAYNETANAPDGQILLDKVQNRLCTAAPEVLVAQPLQGLPVMGTWALARPEFQGALMSSAAAAPISATAPAVSGVTGIEVEFIVGTEALSSNETPAFALQPVN